MALSDIIQKILEDAKLAIEDINKQADEEIKKMEADFNAELEKKTQEVSNNVEKKKGDIEKRMDTLIKMEERNQLLQAKQSIINDVFQKAVSKMAELPDGKYEAILEKLMKKLPKLEEGEIISAKGKKALTEKVMKSVGLTYSLSKEGDFAGGFIFKSHVIEVNGTFEELVLKELKPDIEPEVASVLFRDTFSNMF